MANRIRAPSHSTLAVIGYSAVMALVACTFGPALSRSFEDYAFCLQHNRNERLSPLASKPFRPFSKRVIRRAIIEHSAQELSKLSDTERRSLLEKNGLSESGSKAVQIERLTGGLITPTGMLPDMREAVRGAVQSGMWRLSINDGIAGPPKYIAGGEPNPLGQLGECGGIDCPLCRFRQGFKSVRTQFLDFTVKHIVQYCKDSNRDGLTYCSLGPGFLYFDWQLLERLKVEGIRISQVILVERIYDPTFDMSKFQFTRRALSARDAFASWFADTPVQVRAFSRAEDLRDWANRFGDDASQVDVLMRMDAMGTEPILEDPQFPQTVLRMGAISLYAQQESLAANQKIASKANFEASRWTGDAFEQLELVVRLSES